jgi:formylglycine-generating enzyme required for sulfatase activity
MVILIAIEDADVLRTVEGFLARHTRHKVLTAAEPRDAMALAMGAQAPQIHLLVVDWGFGHGAAEQLGKALRARCPGLYVAYLQREGENGPAATNGHVRILSSGAGHYDLLEWIHELERQPHLGPAPAANAQPPADGESTAPDIALPEGTMLLTLTGARLGDYDVLEKRRDFPKTESYLAHQRTMQRDVVLERLRPEFQHDKAEKRAFRALVRTRASVSHASIAAVYEAHETNSGDIFYSRELVKGKSLEEMETDGQRAPAEVLLDTIRVTAEALTHLRQQGVARRGLGPQDIYLGEDGIARVANIALPEAEGEVDEAAEIEVLANYVQALRQPGSHGESALLGLLRRMRADGAESAGKSWPSLAQEARQALQRASVERTRKTAVLVAPVTANRRRAKRSLAPLALWLSAGAVLAVGAVIVYRQMRKPEVRPMEEMIRIPAGPFVFKDGQKLESKEFWIDKHETTIAAYAKFLEATGGQPGSYDHPDQPKTKSSHKPEYWDEYYAAAGDGEHFRGSPISLNCPVMYVDWWDAYAYARWMDRRLPTEQEWEKAARGAGGLEYPWGAEADAARANTGDDYQSDPAAGGRKDGAAFWADVDARDGPAGDTSPYGVSGMAGNVCEWTSTWSQHPEFFDKTAPVYRGGSFYTPHAPLREQGGAAKFPEYAQPFLGFRTAADKLP